jgi:hypothetical protein
MFGDPIRFQTMSRIYRLLGQGLARPQLAEWLEWVVSGSRVQLLNSGKAWGHGEIYFGALGSRTRELRERGFLDAPSFDSTSKACRTFSLLRCCLRGHRWPATSSHKARVPPHSPNLISESTRYISAVSCYASNSLAGKHGCLSRPSTLSILTVILVSWTRI